LKEAIQEILAEEHEGANLLAELIKVQLKRAIKHGDTRAAELLLKYAYGTPKPMQSEEEEEARPIEVSIVLTGGTGEADS
jgi:hypothetical protein